MVLSNKRNDGVQVLSALVRELSILMRLNGKGLLFNYNSGWGREKRQNIVKAFHVVGIVVVEEGE